VACEAFIAFFLLLGVYLTTGERAQRRSAEKLASMRSARTFGIGLMLLIAVRIVTRA
jgi:hypothetical protein